MQQLESRLRYSKTDKDAAEKRQRLLMEKDLVELQAKLHAFDVSPVDAMSVVTRLFLAENPSSSSFDR